MLVNGGSQFFVFGLCMYVYIYREREDRLELEVVGEGEWVPWICVWTNCEFFLIKGLQKKLQL